VGCCGGDVGGDRLAGAKAARGGGGTGMMLAPLVILVTLLVLISIFSRRAR